MDATLPPARMVSTGEMTGPDRSLTSCDSAISISYMTTSLRLPPSAIREAYLWRVVRLVVRLVSTVGGFSGGGRRVLKGFEELRVRPQSNSYSHPYPHREPHSNPKHNPDPDLRAHGQVAHLHRVPTRRA